MKNKKAQLNNPIFLIAIAIIIIAAIIMLGFEKTGSLVISNGATTNYGTIYDIGHRTVSFDGNTFEAYSPWFGDLSPSGNYYINNKVEDVKLSNSITSGSQLILSSYVSSGDQQIEGNLVNATGNLKGKYKVTCNIDVYAIPNQGESEYGNCKIFSGSKTYYSKGLTINEQQQRQGSIPNSLIDEYVLDLSDITPITFEVQSGSLRGNGKAVLTIEKVTPSTQISPGTQTNAGTGQTTSSNILTNEVSKQTKSFIENVNTFIQNIIDNIKSIFR